MEMDSEGKEVLVHFTGIKNNTFDVSLDLTFNITQAGTEDMMSGSEWIHPGCSLFIEDQGRNVPRTEGGGGVSPVPMTMHVLSFY